MAGGRPRHLTPTVYTINDANLMDIFGLGGRWSFEGVVGRLPFLDPNVARSLFPNDLSSPRTLATLEVDSASESEVSEGSSTSMVAGGVLVASKAVAALSMT